MHHTLICRWFT